MLVRHTEKTPQQDVEMDGAVGVRVRWLISKADTAPNFALREFTVAPGGHTPYHSHDFEHEVFVLEGVGAVVGADGEKPLTTQTVVFIPGGEMHNFVNKGEEPLRFLCIVPNSSY